MIVLQELLELATLQFPAAIRSCKPEGYRWASCCNPALSLCLAVGANTAKSWNGGQETALSSKGINHKWLESSPYQGNVHVRFWRQMCSCLRAGQKKVIVAAVLWCWASKFHQETNYLAWSWRHSNLTVWLLAISMSSLLPVKGPVAVLCPVGKAKILALHHHHGCWTLSSSALLIRNLIKPELILLNARVLPMGRLSMQNGCHHVQANRH